MKLIFWPFINVVLMGHTGSYDLKTGKSTLRPHYEILRYWKYKKL